MKETERFIPGMDGPIWYEHWHRYHFATTLAKGKAVVDAACGEGYGSALLARHAASVVGIDLSADTVALARRRYGATPNLEFREGNCEALPLADASADLVVSFETIEHLVQPRALIAEAARILRPTGLFVVSTPNKALYTDEPGHHNPFHPSEMYESEFVAALHERFPACALFGQRVDTYSAIWPIADPPGGARLLQGRTATAADAAPGLPGAMYFIAMCASSPQALEGIGAPFSLLADQDHRVGASHEALRRDVAAVLAHAERIEAACVEAHARLAALVQERDRLAAQLQALPAGAWQKPR